MVSIEMERNETVSQTSRDAAFRCLPFSLTAQISILWSHFQDTGSVRSGGRRVRFVQDQIEFQEKQDMLAALMEHRMREAEELGITFPEYQCLKPCYITVAQIRHRISEFPPYPLSILPVTGRVQHLSIHEGDRVPDRIEILDQLRCLSIVSPESICGLFNSIKAIGPAIHYLEIQNSDENPFTPEITKHFSNLELLELGGCSWSTGCLPNSVTSLGMVACRMTAMVPPKGLKEVVLHQSVFLESRDFIDVIPFLDDVAVFGLESLYALEFPSSWMIPLSLTHTDSDIVKKLQEMDAECLPAVRRVVLRGDSATFADRTSSAVLPNVAVVYCEDSSCSLDLKSMENFTKLAEIHFEGGIVVAPADHSISLPRLQQLFIHDDVTFDYKLLDLLRLPDLRFLYFAPSNAPDDAQAFDKQYLALLARCPYLCETNEIKTISQARADRYLDCNRITLGLKMAESRVLGSQPVSTGLWPLTLQHSPKAFAATVSYHLSDEPLHEVSQEDAIFEILRKKGAKEIFSAR